MKYRYVTIDITSDQIRLVANTTGSIDDVDTSVYVKLVHDEMTHTDYYCLRDQYNDEDCRYKIDEYRKRIGI